MNKFQLLLVSLAIFLLLLFVVFYFLQLINFTVMAFGVVSNALTVLLVVFFQKEK